MSDAADSKPEGAESSQPASSQPVPSPDDIPFRDPEQADVELKISKDIERMPEEVRDRFKAIKVLTDKLHELDEEEDRAYRAIERKYELLYQKVYEKRAAILKGSAMPDPETIEKFEEAKSKLVDEEYEKLEVPICDVKDIQNTQKGVSGFWVRAMEAHQALSQEISQKDRPILNYLEDIKLELHEEGFGFTLRFIFENN